MCDIAVFKETEPTDSDVPSCRRQRVLASALLCCLYRAELVSFVEPFGTKVFDDEDVKDADNDDDDEDP